MPLNLSNRDQNSGYLFYNRRLRAALTRFSVRMKHDDRKQQAAIALSIVLVLIGCGWMTLLHYMKPAGLIGNSGIIGNRNTGALYARIDGRLYPVFNLTSARLVTGSAGLPTWVSAQEIAKYPTGPMLGTPGIPDDLEIRATTASAWAVCDTAPARGSGHLPIVTAIAGRLSPSDRAAPLPDTHAILVTHNDAAYLIWSGRRSQVDLTDRSVTFNLGLDPGQTKPIPISNALFDALPSTEPIVVPEIPDAGTDSTWLPGARVGRVLESRDATGQTSAFYVLLTGGVQQITGFVADLLRTADSQGTIAPQLISPDKLVTIPQLRILDIDFYPTQGMEFVDTEANPVTCVSWSKSATDRQAIITFFSGRGLPSPPSMDSHIVRLVRDDRDSDSIEASQTLMLSGAANFVATTSGAVKSGTKESLFWLSPQGVRYGIEPDRETLQTLRIDRTQAVQAPWPIFRTFAAGPAISRAGALIARDTISVVGQVEAAPAASPEMAGR